MNVLDSVLATLLTNPTDMQPNEYAELLAVLKEIAEQIRTLNMTLYNSSLRITDVIKQGQAGQK